MGYLNVSAAEIYFHGWGWGWGWGWLAGWLDQLRLKLTQSPTGVGVEVGTELGNMRKWQFLEKLHF